MAFEPRARSLSLPVAVGSFENVEQVLCVALSVLEQRGQRGFRVGGCVLREDDTPSCFRQVVGVIHVGDGEIGLFEALLSGQIAVAALLFDN